MKTRLPASLFSFCVLVLVAGLPAAACASKTQTWRQDGPGDFKQGELSKIVLTSEGNLQLSRQIKRLSTLEAGYIWSMQADGQGNLYIACGNPGGVHRIDKAGKVTTLYRNEKAQVFALSVAKDGAVYAGVSPGGTIVKSVAGKQAEVFSTGETYVWDLALDDQQNVLAATGNQGKLYRITPKHNGRILFQCRQPHLLCVAVEPGNNVLAGTSGDGLVYRIHVDGKPYVLFDVPQADIQCMITTPDGNVYVGTGTPGRPAMPARSALTSSGSDQSGGTAATVPAFAPDAEPADLKVPVQERKLAPVATRNAPEGASAPVIAATPAAPGENAVYRIRRDGAVEEIFREKAVILSLAMNKDRLLIGTGQEGRLFEWNAESGIRAELARLEHGQINTLVSGPTGGTFLATGTPGRLYQLDDQFDVAGSYTSTVLDAKMLARWGKLLVTSQTAEGCKLEVLTRTGNVNKPDDSWTNWSSDSASLPLGRFFQFKIGMTSTGAASPAVKSVALSYATVNRAPVIESVIVPDFEKSPVASATPKLKIQWKASDANGDSLIYDVDVKKDNWPTWVRVARQITALEYEWDPSAFPGGLYQTRVTASDAPSNRDTDAASDAKTSITFLIDRDPPAVTVTEAKSAERKITVRASAGDSQSRVLSAAYSLDGGTWNTLFPDDAIFDNRAESVTFTTPATDPGAHVVMLRFTDAAGNQGVADTVVLVPDPAKSAPPPDRRTAARN